jgi:hypothetical protein
MQMTNPLTKPPDDNRPSHKQSGKLSQPTQPLSPSLELKPPGPRANLDRTTSTIDAETPQEPLDLNDIENVRWVQSRLRELGFLRGGSAN